MTGITLSSSTANPIYLGSSKYPGSVLTVTNTGTVTATGYSAVYTGDISPVVGTIINSGDLNGQYGISLANGGIVLNNINGQIVGLSGGVDFYANGTLINNGTIYGKILGVNFAAGGYLSIGSSGLIEGNGNYENPVVQAASGERVTIVDQGTIISKYTTLGPAAINLTAGVIELSPTAVTNGYIYGGGIGSTAPQSTLALETGPITGTFTSAYHGGFSNIQFNPGAKWVIDAAYGTLTTTPDNLVTQKQGASIYGTTISGFGIGDTLDLAGLPVNPHGETYKFTTHGTNHLLTFELGTPSIFGSDGTYSIILNVAPSITNPHFVFTSDGKTDSEGNMGTDITVTGNVTCFVHGTNIRTALGDVHVEDLAIGDLVATVSGALRPVKWIGRRSYEGRFIAGNHLALPVCIKTNAIADDMPARDLFVSPGHGILIDGVLVPAWRLVNGATITQCEQVDRVEYFHIELVGHDIIFAENCPSESFYDENFRAQFQNVAEFHTLYPQAVPHTAALPRVEAGFALDAIQRRLSGRAGVNMPVARCGALRGFVDQADPSRVTGWVQEERAPEAPVCLDIFAGGSRVARVLANQYRADLREQGLGSGCHAFEVALPAGITGRIEVRRAADGAVLRLTEAARARAA